MYAMASEQNLEIYCLPCCFQSKNRPAQTQDGAHPQNNFCNFITENIRRESSHFQKLLISLVATDWFQETKNWKLWDCYVILVSQNWCRGGWWHVMPMVACDAEGGLWCMFLEVNEVLPVLARIKLTSVCVSVDRSGIMRSSVWSLQTLKRGAQICLQYYYLLYSFGLGTKQVMSVASEAYRSVPFWIYLNNNWNL